jgi:hypothetical protein
MCDIPTLPCTTSALMSHLCIPSAVSFNMKVPPAETRQDYGARDGSRQATDTTINPTQPFMGSQAYQQQQSPTEQSLLHTRALASISSLPCLITLIDLIHDENSLPSSGHSSSCSPLLPLTLRTGQVLYQNNQSLSYWGILVGHPHGPSIKYVSKGIYLAHPHLCVQD